VRPGRRWTAGAGSAAACPLQAGKQAFRQRPSAALCVSMGHPLQNPTQPQLPGRPPSQRWWSCMQ
jgi:hypothetical protein